MNISELIANIISTTHFILILAILIVPFMSNVNLLILYAVFIPFLYLHWITNNNTCALTMLERKLRGSDSDCFTCDIINPIYEFHMNNEQYSVIAYIITFLLWIHVLCKLKTIYI